MAREKLICARLNKQLTQEDVASFAGISRSHYALIESGKRTPSLDVAFKISERLNCDISDIFLKSDVAPGDKDGNNETSATLETA